jgi:hypothetical protein
MKHPRSSKVDLVTVLGSPAKPRMDWATAAKALRLRNEDRLLDPPAATQFDDEKWKW